MNLKETQEFIELAKGEPIDAYSDDGEKRKKRFHVLAKKLCTKLADALGLEPGTYNIRQNMGGIAVCGDTTLHGETIYVNFEQTALGPDCGFMWRGCCGCKDYSGLPNHWMGWDALFNINRVADAMKPIMKQATKLLAAD